MSIPSYDAGADSGDTRPPSSHTFSTTGSLPRVTTDGFTSYMDGIYFPDSSGDAFLSQHFGTLFFKDAQNVVMENATFQFFEEGTVRTIHVGSNSCNERSHNQPFRNMNFPSSSSASSATFFEPALWNNAAHLNLQNMRANERIVYYAGDYYHGPGPYTLSNPPQGSYIGRPPQMPGSSFTSIGGNFYNVNYEPDRPDTKYYYGGNYYDTAVNRDAF